MLYKEDWEKARQRTIAWWKGEIIDRVCLQVYAPKGRPSYAPVPETFEKKWTDIDYVLDCAEESMKNTYFGGEAFPLFWANLGPDIFSAFYGCPLKFAQNTTWVDHIIDDWSKDVKTLRFDRENKWWKHIQKLTEEGARRSNGNFVVGMTDMHAGGDALSALRGPEKLCMDLYDCPDVVVPVLNQLREDTYYVYDRLYELAKSDLWGTSSHVPVWGPGKYLILQCDFMVMVSPEMFRDYFLDDIAKQAKRFDYTVFHLDGQDAIRHLDALLDIPEINAIQWQPGDGAEPMPYWIPLLKCIQEKGKGVWVGTLPEHVEVLLSELKPEGLMLCTGTKSVEEAEHLLRLAERKSLRRK